jgi:hypothetical protein
MTAKIIKVFKENTNLYNLGLGNGFLGIKAKAQVTKEKK